MKTLVSLNRILYLFAPVALFMTVTPAHAGLVTYVDLTSWTAASNGVDAMDFEGLVVADHHRDDNSSTGRLVDGVGFPGYLSAAPNWDLQPYLHVILPGSVSALAVDLMTISPNALTYRITLPGGNSFIISAANITSDTPITSVDLTVPGATNGQGTYGLAANVRFNEAAPAEAVEVCTMLLIGTGLVFFGFLRKIRVRRQAAAA